VKRSDRREEESNYQKNNERLKRAFQSVKNDINNVVKRIVSNENNFENKFCETEKNLKNLFQKIEHIEDVQKKILDAVSQKLDQVKHDYAKEEHLIFTKEHLDKKMSSLNKQVNESVSELKNSLSNVKKNTENVYLTKKEFNKKIPQAHSYRVLSTQINSLSKAIDEKTSFMKEELDNASLRLSDVDKRLKRNADLKEFAKMSKQKADIEDVSRLDKNIEDVLQKISKISIEVDEFNIAKEQISKMHNALINAVVKDDFVSQMVVFEKKLSHLYKEIEHMREDMHKSLTKKQSQPMMLSEVGY